MPQLLSVQKIWDKATHNAFTDLIRFNGKWLCTFREAESHESWSNGIIRIIASDDCDSWESCGEIVEYGVDLRDPKLSVMPNGRLMLLAGGSQFFGVKNDDETVLNLTRSPRVSFSDDGANWTNPKRLLAEDHWLWRATWHNGTAYCISKLGEGSNPRRGFLYSSTDGIDWQWITEIQVPGISESTLRFQPDDQMIALIRTSMGGYIGTSNPPYRDWDVNKLDLTVGGPNFIRLPDGSMWGSGRHHIQSEPKGKRSRTALAKMTTSTYDPVLILPSGGDNSYPGLVWHDDLLWISYYSSHETNTSIYLAKVRI